MQFVVQTAYGAVRGKTSGNGMAWLGVPYAAPPLGELRFKAPVPPVPWTDERDATEYGNACAQDDSGLTQNLGPALSEDCLYLNVHSPAADDAKRPVLVWIHGGAFLAGSGAAYDGTQMSDDGDIVVVTINYRMGAFGFVDLASVVGGGVDANIGIRDQIQALRWVQENIAAFGGDAEQVTVAGESAGSVAVSLLMVCDEAKPYFQRAICQSGTYSLGHGPKMSTELAGHYADVLGLGQGDLEKLQALSTDELVEAQKKVTKRLDGVVAAAPWFDGDLLPASLEDARARRSASVPLLAGINRDEITLFAKLPSNILPTRRDKLEALLRKQFGDERTDKIIQVYPQKGWATTALGSDFAFVVPTANFAQRHSEHSPTWFYRFDYQNVVFGATHALEIVFLWDFTGVVSWLMRGRRTPAKLALGNRMQRAWINFVRDADPGAGWPAFGAPGYDVKIFDKTDRVLSDPLGVRREVWAGLDPTPVPESAL